MMTDFLCGLASPVALPAGFITLPNDFIVLAGNQVRADAQTYYSKGQKNPGSADELPMSPAPFMNPIDQRRRTRADRLMIAKAA